MELYLHRRWGEHLIHFLTDTQLSSEPAAHFTSRALPHGLSNETRTIVPYLTGHLTAFTSTAPGSASSSSMLLLT